MSQLEEFVQEVAAVEKAEEKILVVTGKPGSGKSKVLREAAESKGWDYVDCRLLITESFLELMPTERKEKAAAMMKEVLSTYTSGVIMLDRVQTFFVPVFHIDVPSLLNELGKEFTLVLAWPGYVKDDQLCYDKFDGTESIRMPVGSLRVWEVK